MLSKHLPCPSYCEFQNWISGNNMNNIVSTVESLVSVQRAFEYDVIGASLGRYDCHIIDILLVYIWMYSVEHRFLITGTILWFENSVKFKKKNVLVKHSPVVPWNFGETHPCSAMIVNLHNALQTLFSWPSGDTLTLLLSPHKWDISMATQTNGKISGLGL